MNMIKVLLGADIFLILSGLAWLLLIPSFNLSAFNQTVAVYFSRNASSSIRNLQGTTTAQDLLAD